MRSGVVCAVCLKWERYPEEDCSSRRPARWERAAPSVALCVRQWLRGPLRHQLCTVGAASRRRSNYNGSKGRSQDIYFELGLFLSVPVDNRALWRRDPQLPGSHYFTTTGVDRLPHLVPCWNVLRIIFKFCTKVDCFFFLSHHLHWRGF